MSHAAAWLLCDYPGVGGHGRGQPDEHLDAELPAPAGVVGFGLAPGVDRGGSEITGRAVEERGQECESAWSGGCVDGSLSLVDSGI